MTIRLRPYDRTVITNITVQVDDMDPHDIKEAFRQIVQMLTESSVSVFYVDGADGLAFYAAHARYKVWFLDTEDPEWILAAGPRLGEVYDGTKRFTFTYEMREKYDVQTGADAYFLIVSMEEDDPDASPER